MSRELSFELEGLLRHRLMNLNTHVHLVKYFGDNNSLCLVAVSKLAMSLVNGVFLIIPLLCWF